eukprot:CAMPEP_0184341410 /NCGR_PEP_ID=MMETSP1089-20130417/10023_1 /TAXON_ID=38269 ORGANISM="Gloeochaete wittrockiana, Strain SAG46.84" /NCGR_SAMPLE_ID=MMETSP1089 /ASSEMBLY_ACC=CAM_ASM_000445 /LENGTH=169 /DNA_ID=CAMNT_0026669687 /DNA_START=27 /DNA_END=536 /DNA_ORIENTATION=-
METPEKNAFANVRTSTPSFQKEAQAKDTAEVLKKNEVTPKSAIRKFMQNAPVAQCVTPEVNELIRLRDELNEVQSKFLELRNETEVQQAELEKKERYLDEQFLHEDELKNEVSSLQQKLDEKAAASLIRHERTRAVLAMLFICAFCFAWFFVVEGQFGLSVIEVPGRLT